MRSDLNPALAACLLAVALGATSVARAEVFCAAGASTAEPGAGQVTNFSLEPGIDEAENDASRCAKYLDAVGMLPLRDQWPLLGRLGDAHASLDPCALDHRDKPSTAPASARYSLADNALQGACDRPDPDAFGRHTDLDQYTFGLRIRF